MNERARILLIEDEPRLLALLRDYLEAEGHQVDCLATGAGAVALIRQREPDVLLLDLMLPEVDGLSICREVRQFSDLPILMLTARVDEQDRLEGLDGGADDYICKPFSPREVVARVRAVLRRRPPRSRVPIELDESCFSASYLGQVLDLTPVEFRLLATLAASPGRVWSRDQLLDRLYPDGRVVTDRTVDSHVRNLRRKLQAVGDDPIQSVYGVGYKLEPT